MLYAIDTSVDIEIFIEGRRSLLFNKISSGPAPSAMGSSRSDILGCNNCSSDYANSLPQASGGSVYVRKNILCLYTIIDSFWDKFESKRVFEVEHLSTKYYYYAFVLDDYIVCPAFLARSLDITHYACLNVIYGNNYPYIFVKAKSYDSNLNIAGDQFKTHREHVFKLSMEEDKVLNLTFENTFLNIFIEPRNFKFSSELYFEWSKMLANQKGIPESSLLHPNYSYIPEEKFRGFKSIHEDFLKVGQYFGNNALIHQESKSYSEMYLWSSKVKRATTDLEFQIVSFGEIFTAVPYKREDYILDQLVDHIKRNYKKSKDKQLNEYYCSIIAILQSSGYGKSKLMERLGSRTPTFYSSLQSGMGFPRKSIFFSRLIEELDIILESNRNCYMNNVSAAVYIYMLRILYIILNNTEDTTFYEYFKIDKIKNCKEFSNIPIGDSGRIESIFEILFDEALIELCKSPISISFDGTMAKKLSEFLIEFPHLIRFITDFEIIIDIEEAVMEKLEKITIDRDLPSIFVIDEAKGLHCKRQRGAEKNYNWSFQDWDFGKGRSQKFLNLAPYNVFRRIFRMFKYTWERLMLIVISTSGQITMSLPELELDPSFRQTTDIKLIENFSLVNTYNVNSELALTIKSDSFPNWNKFLKSKERIEEFFNWDVL
jgi:hypothetical protein